MANNQMLFFTIENKTYGLDVLKIESIERVGNITRVPNAPTPTVGIMNLRGNIVPIISLRQKLGLQRPAFDDEMRIIVIDDKDDSIGLLVDKILDVREVNIEDLYVDGDSDKEGARDFIRGAIKDEDGTLVIVLHSGKLTMN